MVKTTNLFLQCRSLEFLSYTLHINGVITTLKHHFILSVSLVYVATVVQEYVLILQNSVKTIHSAALDRGTKTKSMRLLVCKYTFIITEKKLRLTVKAKLPEFIELTNWEYFVPRLVSKDLLDPAAMDYLLNENRTEHKKGEYFYLKVLPTKGPDAYTRFYECLRGEKKHSGHKTLLQFCDLMYDA